MNAPIKKKSQLNKKETFFLKLHEDDSIYTLEFFL